MSTENNPTKPLPYNVTIKTHNDIYPAIDPEGALKGSCQGKVVLITGAGRGIGKAIAIAFAQAGASTLILTSRSTEELTSVSTEISSLPSLSSPPRIITQSVDVTSESSVSDLFKRLQEEEKVEVDVLINNAGYLMVPARIGEGEVGDWWKCWEVNVLGTYLPTHFLLKSRNQYSSPSHPLTIINTSSIGALTTRPGFSSYQPSKTAINRFTEFLHKEYNEEGVRCFAYHPGGVMTKLAGNMPKETHGVLIDKPELAAGFAVWIVAMGGGDGEGNQEGGQDKLRKWRGRYLSCNWDVDELMSVEAGGKEEDRWGVEGWGMTRTVW